MHSNRLIHEQSPYLLQHAHNPVDWYPWGDEPFAIAREENKPVLVSIGYAACHWCHVMERESFENEEVAAYMNDHFICIKVDREEHPDVDHMYMDAVQAISGSGGWPLNVFVTGDRVPFYGGTYYPPRPAYSRPSWPQLLQRMVQVWHEQHDQVAQQAEQMVAHLRQSSQRMFTATPDAWTADVCDRIAANLLAMADKVHGGFGGAPKFPGTMAIGYLLEHYHFTGNEESLRQALRSLDAMADGGIYDQLGGGFARYSTDAVWLAPHFEKMLYDNALLIGNYCDAYAITHEERYKTIAEETIAFAERELKDNSGGYYCALDADSEGVEGKYYTWDIAEWNELLGADAALLAAHYDVSVAGNWEHTNILHIARSVEQVADEFQLPVAEVKQKVASAKNILYAARRKRVRPQTDDKCLLSWNALMNIALSKAGAAFGDDALVARSAAHMQWMLQQFESKEGLLHSSKNGVARIPAKLDDYACLANALVHLATATGSGAWLWRGTQLMETIIRDFAHEEGFFYYTPAGQSDIPVRKVDLYDGATPSANAVMAHNLAIYGLCMERPEWSTQAQQMLEKIGKQAAAHAYSFSYWAQQIQRSINGAKTIIIACDQPAAARRQFIASFLPQVYCLCTTGEEKPVPLVADKYAGPGLKIFLCTNNACLQPVEHVSTVLDMLGPDK